MVMSGGGEGDPRDDPDETKTELIDCSYQNHAKAIFRKGRHRGSNFRRAAMVEADLMKSAFDGADFRGADLKKARCNLSNFRNCKLEGADLRGIRGKYAIWQGSDWWNAILNDDLAKALAKKWPRPTDHSDSS